MEDPRQRGDRVGIDAAVEVHGHLHDEDDGQNGPFLVPGPRIAQSVVAIVLAQFALAIRTGLLPLAVGI